MDIRHADYTDLGDIVRIGDQIQAQHAADYPEEFVYPMDQAAVRAFFMKVLDDGPKHEIIAACGDDGTVLGYLWFERQQRRANVFKHWRKRLYVHHVGVDATSRGKGVGTAMFDHVNAAALAEGRTEIALDTWSRNEAAHGFFAAQGYKQTQLILTRRLAP